MAIIPVFQTGDRGSIPLTRSKENCFSLLEQFSFVLAERGIEQGKGETVSYLL